MQTKVTLNRGDLGYKILYGVDSTRGVICIKHGLYTLNTAPMHRLIKVDKK